MIKRNQSMKDKASKVAATVEDDEDEDEEETPKKVTKSIKKPVKKITPPVEEDDEDEDEIEDDDIIDDDDEEEEEVKPSKKKVTKPTPKKIVDDDEEELDDDEELDDIDEDEAIVKIAPMKKPSKPAPKKSIKKVIDEEEEEEEEVVAPPKKKSVKVIDKEIKPTAEIGWIKTTNNSTSVKSSRERMIDLISLDTDLDKDTVTVVLESFDKVGLEMMFGDRTPVAVFNSKIQAKFVPGRVNKAVPGTPISETYKAPYMEIQLRAEYTPDEGICGKIDGSSILTSKGTLKKGVFVTEDGEKIKVDEVNKEIIENF